MIFSSLALAQSSGELSAETAPVSSSASTSNSTATANHVIDTEPFNLDRSETIFLILGVFFTILLAFMCRAAIKANRATRMPPEQRPPETPTPEPSATSVPAIKPGKSFLRTFRSFFSAEVRPESFDQIEELLYTSDLSHETIQKLLPALETDSTKNFEFYKNQLREKFTDLFHNEKRRGDADPLVQDRTVQPLVFLIVGTNGAGKTTTIGKLSARYLQQGKKVLVVSSDTFRAAAHAQLKTWTERAQVEFFVSENSSDPSSIAFDGISKGKAGGFDIVLVDTAGRLHHQAHLMSELQKVTRVIQKVISGAPHETILVVDGNTGQNGLTQAREFHKALKLTGVILTKLDGTAKGGIVISICDELHVPVYFLGVGEKIEDLEPFSSEQFLDALLN